MGNGLETKKLKALIPVKRVIDYTSSRIKILDKLHLEKAFLKWTINPFDAIAVEETIRLKEKNQIEEVIAISIGEESCQETLRMALAMGADRGIWIESDQTLSSLSIAKILRHISIKESVDLVIMGKQAVDDDNNQTGQMLAGLLNWSQGTFASEIVLDSTQVKVTREVDTGLDVLLLNLPAVITTDLRLNEPRYLSLPNIIQAKKKSIEKLNVKMFELPALKNKIIELSQSKRSRLKISINNAAELIQKLKNEAHIVL